MISPRMWLSSSFSSFKELKDFELGELLAVLHGLEVGLASGGAAVPFPFLVLECVLRVRYFPWDTGIDLDC